MELYCLSVLECTQFTKIKCHRSSVVEHTHGKGGVPGSIPGDGSIKNGWSLGQTVFIKTVGVKPEGCLKHAMSLRIGWLRTAKRSGDQSPAMAPDFG